VVTLGHNASGQAELAAGSSAAADNTLNIFGSPTIFGLNAVNERARIDSSGRLLVGTSSSIGGNTLESVSNIGIYRFTAADSGPYLNIGKSRSATTGTNTLVQANDQLGTIAFYGANGATYLEGAHIRALAEGTPSSTSMGSRLVFSTTADGASSPTERMRITSGGRVDIGTTVDPGATLLLHVKATGHSVSRFETNTSASTCLQAINTATSGDNVLVSFFTDSYIQRGTIDYNRAGGAIRYNTTSDARLKSEVADANSAIELLPSIRVRSYVWTESGYKVDYGFVAQELHQVVPDAVKVGDNGDEVIDAWAVDYSKVVPILTKALQEALVKIETLQAKVAALEGV
jgi:hypothetical protein